MEEIERVAISSRDPILLTGPTGSGKSRLARRIYELKKARRQVEGRFVEVNCATLRDEEAMLLRAIEEKRFLPLGSDEEAASEFQLIAGTNRDLRRDVEGGRFREDLLARINLWTFELPGLRRRLEDLEPNIDYEIEGSARATGKQVSFNTEARRLFVEFAVSPEAQWRGNFRDLNAAITRMATLAPGGRITVEGVREEIARLRTVWRRPEPGGGDELLEEVLGAPGAAALDRFDRVQLAAVIEVARRSSSLSEAGRVLFAVSRTRKKSANDADRLKKYLARFGLDWERVKR